MTKQNLPIDAYMARFESALRKHTLPQAGEIAADVRSHIQEALDHGKSLDATLSSLGSAEALARAYAIELLANNRGAKSSVNFLRAAQLAGLLAATGMLSAVVITALGGIGVTLMLSSAILLGVGVFEAMGIHLPHVQTGGLSPLSLMALAPAAFATGWMLYVLLMRYLRFIARGVYDRLPTRGAT